MSRALPIFGAIGCLLLSTLARAQPAPGAFKDVPTTHWAYQAIDSLRSRGMLIGYSEAYFSSRRTLTRYEFAVAINRALTHLVEKSTEKVASTDSPAGPGDVAILRKLAAEFAVEMAAIGASPESVDAMLAKLETGAVSRTTGAQGGTPIPGGAAPARNTVRGTQVASTHLPVPAGTYGSSLGSVQLQVGYPDRFAVGSKFRTPRPTTNLFGSAQGGTGTAAGRLTLDSDADPRPAGILLNAPLFGLRGAASISFGSLRQDTSGLSLMRSGGESFAAGPLVDDGMYRMEGLRLSTRLGSVDLQAFAGLTESVAGTGGGSYNSPFSGMSDATAGGLSGALTTGQLVGPTGFSTQGQRSIQQLGGVSLALPVRVFEGGRIRLTGIGASGTGPTTLSNAAVLGADTQLNVTPRLTLSSEWATVNSGTGLLDTGDNGQNNAYAGTVDYRSGLLNVSAGYKYVDPLFYAPGYWGRIGSWLNPTNIQGPMFRAEYGVGRRLALNLGGDFYWAARSRDTVGGIGTDDDLQRVLVSVRWDLSRNLRTNLDWEGVYWNLSGSHSGLPGLTGSAHPAEHYVTISTGYSLTNNALLRLGYQISDFGSRSAVFGGSGTAAASTLNTFTGQMAIKF